MAKILLEADTNDVEKKLIELKIDPALVKKLLALGEPFKKACRVLGYSVKPENGGNPILAFVLQDYVIKNLLNTALLNAGTFKAIYNAVAKHLVADSEFFKANNYNIIYCKNLYKKSPKEIEEYLTLQNKILEPSNETYSQKDQERNRKTFLYIKGMNNIRGEEELNLVKRAIAVNKLTDVNKIPKVEDAITNSIELAKEIYSRSSAEPTIHRNADELDKIVAKLTGLASKFAAILLLCTKSTKVKQALNHPKFSELNQKLIADAFMKLSKDSTFPKVPLREDDADLLVAKILVTLKPQEN
jgi:hypothetical protein